MQQTRQMYRQGDVLLVPVDELPEDAKEQERDRGRIVLAYGEATGHAHAIADDGAQLFEAVEERGSFRRSERFLRLVKPSALRHEEHAPIVVREGVYRVVRQREWQPTASGRSSYVND